MTKILLFRLYQEKYNLEKIKILGLNQIYKKITELGINGVEEILLNLYKNKELKILESKGKGSYFKRRKPEQSEIKVSDFNYYTAEEIFNKIIGLQDPYPNAFIKCKNGSKLFLTNAKYEK